MKVKLIWNTRQLIDTQAITDYSLATDCGDEPVYFIIVPTNIFVLSEKSVSARIYALMTVLKGIAELEFLCLNSRKNFEDNTSSFFTHGWSRRITPLCGGFWSKISPSSTGCRCRWRRPENFWW